MSLLLMSRKKYKPVTFPSGLGWDQVNYPLTVKYNGKKYKTDFVPEAYATEALAGTACYVDVATGADTNTGLGSYPLPQFCWMQSTIALTA